MPDNSSKVVALTVEINNINKQLQTLKAARRAKQDELDDLLNPPAPKDDQKTPAK